ncbi:MAG TPA: hypothetical protein VGK48_04400 [Terriglobia bacterium]
MPPDMRDSPTRTGDINHVAGIYHSKCHSEERTILEGQRFPRCARCNADTVWLFVRPAGAPKTALQAAGN